MNEKDLSENGVPALAWLGTGAAALSLGLNYIYGPGIALVTLGILLLIGGMAKYGRE